MCRFLTIGVLLLLSFSTKAQFQGLIVNEFSQGNTGNREYIEIVVVGNRTCTDSTADIRGWIFDDQNGWYGNSNSTQGHYRFRDVTNWSQVPFGSIILLYNSADKNQSISLADDPTDADGDLTYIVPINSSAYLEQFAAGPNNTAGPSYAYPAANSATGYVPTTNQWQFLIALNNNNGDVISLVSPGNRNSAFFSIGYGYVVNAGFQSPLVNILNVGGNNSAFLSTGNYLNGSDWQIANVPINETPGLPNGGANTGWIDQLRLGRPKIVAASAATPICFSSNNQQTTLSYSSTWNAPDKFSITWNATPANSFLPVVDAVLPLGSIAMNIPGGTNAGTYTGYITVTNASGTSCNPVPFTITVNPLPAVTAGTYGPLCSNISPLSLSGSPSGGTFSGSGVSGNIFTPPGAGSYGLQYSITDAVTGCSNTAATNIIVNPQPLVAVTPLAASICNNNAGMTITASGAITYSWNPANSLSAANGSTVIANPSSTTTYTVTGTDANGCSNTATATVAVNHQPAAPQLSLVQPSCSNVFGSITVTSPSGPGHAYSIDGVDYSNTSGVFANLSPGTYTISVQNSNGCLSLPTPGVIHAQPITPTVSVNSPVICPGTVATITATTLPAGSYNYTWIVPSGVSNPGNVANFSASVAGSYSVTVTGVNVCSNVATGVLSVTPLATVSADNKQVCVGSTVALTGQPTGGVWSGANVNGNQFDAAGLAPGNYQVTYTYTAGSCSGSATAMITVNPIPPPPTITVANLCNGTSMLTASNFTGTLSWSSGGVTMNPVIVPAPGPYTVFQIVNGCASNIATANAAPSSNPTTPVIINVQQPNCITSTGSFQIVSPTGTGLSYSIDGINYTNTTGIFSSLAPGSYAVIARNSNGCVSDPVTVVINAAPSAPTVPVVQTSQPSCFSSTGSFSVLSPVGQGITYSISVGNYQASTTFTGLAPGTYLVHARNASGCISPTTQVVINQPPSLPIPSVSVQQPTCIDPTGSITISFPAAGNGFTYSINGVNYTNSSGIFTNLASGIYNVSVQNNSGCISPSSTVIINSAPVVPSVTVNSPQVCPGSSATIAVTPSPLGSYSYVWTVPAGVSNPGNVANFSAATAGTYTVILTNSSGCSSSASGILSISSTASVTADNKEVCAGSSVLLTGQPAGGVWSGTGVNGAQFDATTLSPGQYMVTYTHTAGACSGSATATVLVKPVPGPPTLSVVNNCNGTSDLTAINFSGSLLWSTGQTVPFLNVGSAGSYSATQTINGCTSVPATVTANPFFTPAAPVVSNVQQPDCTVPSGSIMVSVPAGSNYFYSINGINYTNTSGQFTGLVPGSYPVSVRNSDGCTSASTLVTINAVATTPSAPIVQLIQPNCTLAAGSMTVISPVGAGFEYSLNGSAYQSAPVFINLQLGNYSIRVRNSSGCVSLPTSFSINQPAGTVSTSTTICLAEGASYNFNGQVLTSTGNYSTTYSRPGLCDSVVRLYLLVNRTEIQSLNGCGSITYNGVGYTTSTTLRDTIKSVVTNCDSLYRIVNIVIHSGVVTQQSVCLPAGQSHPFNNQLLTASGWYSAVFTMSSGCDSTVNLALTITELVQQQLTDCDAVIYNGTTYTSSTTLTETIPSLLTGCDSIVRTIAISITPKPSLTISRDQTICRGDSVLLRANAGNNLVEWLGFGVVNELKVSPSVTTTYTAVATSIAGCTDTARVTITVSDFDVDVLATPNPAIAGKTVQLQTSANASYQILTWQPVAINQTTRQQTIIADSTVMIKVVARSSAGCIDVDSVLLVIDPLGDIYIPTAFTPNGDGKNDLFTVGGGHFTKFELLIFNRWGQVVFQSTERSRGWDGRLAGKEQPTGTYVYQLSAKTKDGKLVKRSGTINLIR